MNSIYDCDIIKQLSDDFVQQIKCVFIDFGGKAVLCVTNDDDVYAYGDNTMGYLGLGHKDVVNRPTKIEELCHKQVITIESGNQSLVALTKTGQIYSWGLNSYGQIGNGSEVDCFKPVIISSLSEKFIIDVKCGAYHCLALTLNGEVFEWGWSVTDTHNTVPIRVRSGLELHTITAISCGDYHSLALTDNGDVFSWGENDCGQCGHIRGHYDDHIIPIKLEMLCDIKIVKIKSRLDNNILLSDCGDIYVFGVNEIIDDDTNSVPHPIKLNDSNKFVDIDSQSYECSINSELSEKYVAVGLSIDGFCYVWVSVDEHQLITQPKKTRFTDINEACAVFTKFQYRTYYLKKEYETLSATDRFKKSFNKQELCDISFKIDGKLIYALKAYLKRVCKHFDAMFSDNVWLESNAKEIEITQYSYSVYYSFLKYLYTDSLDIQSKHLIDLYYFSDSYIEENLKQKCIEMMKMTTNVNNVYTFYSFAVKHNLVELEKYFYDYMLTYMSDVIKTEAYIQTNDDSIVKKFLNTSLTIGNLTQNKRFKSTNN